MRSVTHFSVVNPLRPYCICGYTSPQSRGEHRYNVVDSPLSCPHFGHLKWRKPKIDRHLRAFFNSLAWVHHLSGTVCRPPVSRNQPIVSSGVNSGELADATKG